MDPERTKRNDQETIDEISERHNVTIDVDSTGHLIYTHGSIDDHYGWMPVPQEWIDECNA